MQFYLIIVIRVIMQDKKSETHANVLVSQMFTVPSKEPDMI